MTQPAQNTDAENRGEHVIRLTVTAFGNDLAAFNAAVDLFNAYMHSLESMRLEELTVDGVRVESRISRAVAQLRRKS